MHRCLAALFFALSISSTALAADAGPQKAVLFQFNGLSTIALQAFNETPHAAGLGGGIGGKYFLLPNIAIRGNLLFDTVSATTPANPGVGQQGLDGSASATMFGIGVAGEYHLIRARVSPYVGAALTFATTSTSSKAASQGAPTAPPQTTIDNKAGGENFAGFGTFVGATTFSASALAGVEFFPWENISFAAEYQLGYTGASLKDDKRTTNNVTTTTKQGSAGEVKIATAQAGLLTMAIYF